MYELKVVSGFGAAHHLRNFYGKCEDLHGHNWKVEVYVTSEDLDQAELVMDFGLIKKHLAEVIEDLDHKYLNDLEFFKVRNPSSENIARFIYEGLAPRIQAGGARLSRVSAWESETSCATYWP
ncbi:MAG: 6-carboxytetrahydropterin synthase QueD [Proteobacteria bacterium]|nr:6-carboxytetrahydropterin synthase QueD [Pseudomonadota bacterium]